MGQPIYAQSAPAYGQPVLAYGQPPYAQPTGYAQPPIYQEPHSSGINAGTAALAGGAAGLIGGMMLEGALENQRRHEFDGLGGGFGAERVFEETRPAGFFGSKEVITDVRTDMFGDRIVETEVIDRDMFGNVEDVRVTETIDFW